MPAYSANSKQRLSSCHVDLRTLFEAVIEEVDCTIVCGHREKREQDEAYEKGYSMLPWPQSKHNQYPSMAVDVAPYTVQIRNIDWNDIKSMCVFAGQVDMIACRLRAEGKITHGIRWGGDWDGDGRTVDQKFHDLPHFELIP